MKTDRELLELAARACGYTPDGIFGRGLLVVINVGQPDQRSFAFDPLHDDGDALRLAVKLRLSIDHNHSADQQRWVAADRNGCEGCYAPVSCVEDDFDDESQRSSATRRAIVRAAAEIQLQKEREQ